MNYIKKIMDDPSNKKPFTQIIKHKKKKVKK